MKLHLKACQPEHLSSLIQIARHTFVEAFEKQNKPDDFKAYITTAFSKGTIKKQLQNPNCQYYFVKRENDIVGYMKLNENDAQTELKGDETMELERIYVSRDYQGQKIGEWMLKKALNIASKKQKEYLWLGVWEHNTAAIRFYRKHKFIKFGEHPYYVGNDKQMDWLMRRDLATLEA